MRFWQVVTAISLGLAMPCLAAGKESFVWEAPKVTRSVFSPKLGMMNSERDEYATNFAALAVNGMINGKASADSLEQGRIMIALALQLSPRNKRAIVANFQLSKGMLPERVDENYGRASFSRLLLARGQLLEKDPTDENLLLARMFLSLAASLDPKNEDAVYACEVHRLDHGEIDWSRIMGESDKKSDSGH